MPLVHLRQFLDGETLRVFEFWEEGDLHWRPQLEAFVILYFDEGFKIADLSFRWHCLLLLGFLVVFILNLDEGVVKSVPKSLCGVFSFSRWAVDYLFELITVQESIKEGWVVQLLFQRESGHFSRLEWF